MIKKKHLLLSALSTLMVVTSLTIAFTHKNHNLVRGEEHGPSCVWNHYYAVQPKTGLHGSREFWSCCTHHTYTLTEPETGVINEAGIFCGTYFNNLSQLDDRYIPKIGSLPKLIGDNQIEYGIYPQNCISNSSLISNLNNLSTPEPNGWYLYEGDYYAKTSGKPYKSNYVFDNGTTIIQGTNYWFKCDPLVWNILNNDNGNYYLLSTLVLDSQKYDRSSGGMYPVSTIRTWLNTNFYNSAFYLGDDYIETTTVDNSARTLNSNNPYSSYNTDDKIFMPSYKDYLNTDYGFSNFSGTSNLRCCKTTDWARANGAYYSTVSSFLFNGYYWTRSPSSLYTAWSVIYDGQLSQSGVTETQYGVRPSLTLCLN